MGVPVSPRNIFPSNIQGLPTWYEVRVNDKGYQGRRGGVDLMVAMNPQTWDKDLQEIEAGGYLFYDSSKPMPKSKFRDDVNVIGIPLTEICNATYSDPRQRQLFKNIIYVGALSALLDIDPAEIEKLFSEQYKGKEALLQSNSKALKLGRDYATQHLTCPLGIRIQRSNNVGNKVLSTATAPRRWARFMAALRCARGIRSRRRRHWPKRLSSIARNCARNRKPAGRVTPSFRARTNSHQVASPSARAGTARVHSPRRLAPAYR
jgi:Pyruvate/2-oxoacid:ferredoxin oxidoreductase gamma subunit